MNKKIVLIMSGVLAVISLAIDFSKSLYCDSLDSKFQIFCIDSFQNLTDIFSYAMIFVPIFLYSIITYFLHNSTFIAWRKFTLWWVVIASFLIFISPSETRGWFMITNPKEMVALFSSGGYTFFAMFLVLYKSWRLRKS